MKYITTYIFCININFMYVVRAEVINVSDVAVFLENETNTVTFSCQATGEPVPNISWYFNSVVVNTSNTSEYNVTNSINRNFITSLFTIVNTKLSDVGNYTCYIENIFGDDQNFIVLVVNGKQYLMILIFNS